MLSHLKRFQYYFLFYLRYLFSSLILRVMRILQTVTMNSKTNRSEPLTLILYQPLYTKKSSIALVNTIGIITNVPYDWPVSDYNLQGTEAGHMLIVALVC